MRIDDIENKNFATMEEELEYYKSLVNAHVDKYQNNNQTQKNKHPTHNKTITPFLEIGNTSNVDLNIINNVDALLNDPVPDDNDDNDNNENDNDDDAAAEGVDDVDVDIALKIKTEQELLELERDEYKNIMKDLSEKMPEKVNKIDWAIELINNKYVKFLENIKKEHDIANMHKDFVTLMNKYEELIIEHKSTINSNFLPDGTRVPQF